MESHKGIRQCIVKFSFNRCFPHGCRYGIVDIQKCYCIFADAGTNVLTQRAIDIDFAGNRNSAACQTAVDVARFKSELLRECRPAFICKRHILARPFMCLCPVKQCQLELCHTWEHLRISISGHAQLFCHIVADFLNSRIVGMCFEGDQKIQLGILFDLDAKFVKPFDRCVAGKEILWSRTKGDDLQIFQSQYSSCNRNKIFDHSRDIFCGSDRIFRNVCFDLPHAQIVRAVQHTTISIATAIDQITITFCCCHKHARSVEAFCNQCLRCFRAKVAKEYNKCIDACLPDIVHSCNHILFIFHGDFAFINITIICFYDVLSSCDRKTDREAVSADCDDPQFYLRYIFHDLLLYHSFLIENVFVLDDTAAWSYVSC